MWRSALFPAPAFGSSTRRRRRRRQPGITIEAWNLRKTVRDKATRRKKALLDDISLVVNAGEFIGIIGSTGSGKSTLLDALSGRRPADGTILYNGIDLYQAFDHVKPTIGWVPQQDIVHRRITIQKALTYTALLRLPEQITLMDIERRVERVLDRVGMANMLRQRIDTPVPLSGGQLKRVNVATELISDPEVLFLDEPTSGLDAATDKRLMELFGGLANDGKTVICVTHTLNNIDMCSVVAVLHRGILAYFGPPASLSQYFRLARIIDVYETLESMPPECWAERYKKSDLHAQFVAARRRQHHGGAANTVSPAKARAAQHPGVGRRQTRILTRRYLDLIAADKKTLALLLLQAPIIALIAGAVFSTGGPLPRRFRVDRQVMFTLIMSAIWLGCLNSAREIVKELPIYLRERAVNLRLGPYLISKLIPLTGLCALQCAILLGVVSYMVPIPGSTAERGAVLFLTALAASGMGLMVSALSSSADKALAVIPVLLIPQMILPDVSIRLDHVSRAIAKATIIAFWSFNAIKETLPQDVRAIDPTPGSLWPGALMLALFFMAYLGCAAIGLRLKDRGAFRPPRNPLVQKFKVALVVALPVTAALLLYLGPERDNAVDFFRYLVEHPWTNDEEPQSATGEEPATHERIVAGGMDPGSRGTPAYAVASQPAIDSVSPVLPQPNQTIVIAGRGLGSLAPFNGNSGYLRIRDISRAWNAGWGRDWVHLMVEKWTDSQIFISGFTGSYGLMFWSLHPGDQLAIDLWNPQTGAGPVTYDTVVARSEPPSVRTP